MGGRDINLDGGATKQSPNKCAITFSQSRITGAPPHTLRSNHFYILLCT